MSPFHGSRMYYGGQGFEIVPARLLRSAPKLRECRRCDGWELMTMVARETLLGLLCDIQEAR
jgi:hypothetical protein